MLVRADGKAGLSEWSSETKTQFIRGETQEEDRVSEGSIVVVKDDTDEATVKPEEPSLYE